MGMIKAVDQRLLTRSLNALHPEGCVTHHDFTKINNCYCSVIVLIIRLRFWLVQMFEMFKRLNVT